MALLLLGAALLLAACQGWSYRPDPDFCSLRTAVAEEICAQRERCLGVSSAGHEACVTAEARAFEDHMLVAWRHGVRHARMRYHSGRVPACREAMAVTDCSIALSRTLPMECARLASGRQKLGEQCDSDLECAHGRLCGFGGTCEDLAVPGCTLLCIEATRCRGGAIATCSSAVVGSLCESWLSACGGLLACDWDGSSTTGTCRQAIDITPPAEGESCWLDLSGGLCADGLQCAEPVLDAGVAIGTCESPPPPPPCGDAGPCATGFGCGWADAGPRCVPVVVPSLAPEGASCREGVDCASGVCGVEAGWFFSSRICIPSRCE